MNVTAYIAALLEELRAPRNKDHEASIRQELTRLGVAAPKAKGTAAPVAPAEAEVQPSVAPEQPKAE